MAMCNTSVLKFTNLGVEGRLKIDPVCLLDLCHSCMAPCQTPQRQTPERQTPENKNF